MQAMPFEARDDFDPVPGIHCNNPADSTARVLGTRLLFHPRLVGSGVLAYALLDRDFNLYMVPSCRIPLWTSPSDLRRRI
mmetsp:Transcript_25361/g.54091  ORF Transcript_25361/g.54091 Transcript_25361/m.54091 type:complete len:80 (+) Transcript_25361:2-241(+)